MYRIPSWMLSSRIARDSFALGPSALLEVNLRCVYRIHETLYLGVMDLVTRPEGSLAAFPLTTGPAALGFANVSELVTSFCIVG